MPHLDAGALATFFFPALCDRGFTKAREQAIQQTTSSTSAAIRSIRRIIGEACVPVSSKARSEP
jgi:hypothetical protein